MTIRTIRRPLQCAAGAGGAGDLRVSDLARAGVPLGEAAGVNGDLTQRMLVAASAGR